MLNKNFFYLKIIKDKYSVLMLNKTDFPYELLKEVEALFLSIQNDDIFIITNQSDLIKKMNLLERPFWIGFRIIADLDYSTTEALKVIVDLFYNYRINIFPISTLRDDFFLLKDFEIDRVLEILSEKGINVKL